MHGEGNGNALQCSCLENPRDRGAWWAAIYGVTQSWTQLKWLSSSSSSSSKDLGTRELAQDCQARRRWGLEFRVSDVFGQRDCYRSVAQSCLTLCNPMDCSIPGFPVLTISQSLLKLMSIESMMPSNHLILCHPLLLPSVFPRIRIFSRGLALCIRWLKYWSSIISPSNEYSGLISFRMDWFDLLAVQGTLKSLLFWTTVQKHQFFGT